RTGRSSGGRTPGLSSPCCAGRRTVRGGSPITSGTTRRTASSERAGGTGTSGRAPVAPTLERSHRIAPGHGVVRPVLVQLGERRIVVAGVDEELGAGPAQQRGEPDVHQLRRLLADDVHPEQLHVLAPEDELQEAAAITDDLPAGIGGIRRTPDDVVHAGL